MTHIPNLQVKFVKCHNYERVMLKVQSYCLQNFKFQAEPSAYVLRSTYFYGLLQVLILCLVILLQQQLNPDVVKI